MKQHIEPGSKNLKCTLSLEINGLTFELERKRIKNLYLKVLPPEGRLHVSAPVRMPNEAIIDFVLSKQAWIRKQQEKLRNRADTAPFRNPEYLSGEEVYLWGSCFPLEVRYQQRNNRAYYSGTAILLHVKKGEGDSLPKERYGILKQLYREELEEKLPDLFSKWEEMIGVKAKEWNLRDMTTRWGSCNVKEKKICLNLKLAGKSPECLEYVVVHELVHLLESSHNHIFKSYMDQFLPEWRNRKAMLNGRSSR